MTIGDLPENLTREFREYVDLCADSCSISWEDAFYGMYFGIGNIAGSIDSSISSTFIMDAYIFNTEKPDIQSILSGTDEPSKYIRQCQKFLTDCMPLITSRLLLIREYYNTSLKVLQVFDDFFNPYISTNISDIKLSDASGNWVITKEMKEVVKSTVDQIFNHENDLQSMIIAVFLCAISSKKRFTKPVTLREALAKIMDVYHKETLSYLDLTKAYNNVSRLLKSTTMYQKQYEFMSTVSLYIGFTLK